MYYSNLFLFFSIIGYAYEIFIRIINHLPKTNLLLGPWMPIYGFGILIIEWNNQLLNLLKIKGKKKIILCFIMSIILLTFLEWIGGILVEKLFFTSFWNYENLPLNIGKYISIFVSLLWGIFAILIEYIIIPIIKPWIGRIPNWITYILLFMIILDHIYLLTKLLQ